MRVRDRISEFRRVPARDLLPHPKNWRTHPEAQRAALRAVLAEVGYADALVARKLPDGRLQLIDGHLRAETTPDQEVPVLVLDVTEEEAEKLLVSLDPLAAMAGRDETILRELLAGVKTESAALQTLLNELAPPPLNPGLTDPDEIPEPPAEPVTRVGDLWVLGDHRLLCGDSAREEDVDRLVGGAAVHLVHADPPYNVRVEPRSNNAIAAGQSSFSARHHQKLDLARHPNKAKATHRQMRAKDRPLRNDFIPKDEFARMLHEWFGNLARVLLPGHGFYLWGGYANCGDYPPVLEACGLYFSQAIIWVKEHPVLTRKDFMGNHEWCFYGWKEGAAHRYFGPPNVPDVWSVKKVSPTKMVHLTEKPVELARRAIEYSSRPRENVLDLFGGSGSTLIAAERTGRRALLMEIDPLYCDVIVRRWENFTGKKATHTSVVGAGASAPVVQARTSSPK